MASLIRVAPEVSVTDISKAVEYYVNKLGFEVVMEMPQGDYVIVERDGAAIHLFDGNPTGHSASSMHIFVDGLDALFAEIQSLGANITQSIVRQPWGNRDFRVVDPSGNTLKFTEPLDEDDDDL